MVKALQSMSRNALYGAQVETLLAKSPVWAEFQGQKHDLFISSAPTAGYLTGNKLMFNYTYVYLDCSLHTYCGDRYISTLPN